MGGAQFADNCGVNESPKCVALSVRQTGVSEEEKNSVFMVLHLIAGRTLLKKQNLKHPVSNMTSVQFQRYLDSTK